MKEFLGVILVNFLNLIAYNQTFITVNYLNYYQRLQYLKEAIEHGRVFSPKTFAQKLDCSEKTIRNMINHLREDDIDVKYSKALHKYIIA